jgi:hypothetical protein
MAYRRGKLNPDRPIAFLIIIYAITTAITPFVQPRYNYFAYVLLALELARNEDPDGTVQAQPPDGRNAIGRVALNHRADGLPL